MHRHKNIYSKDSEWVRECMGWSLKNNNSIKRELIGCLDIQFTFNVYSDKMLFGCWLPFGKMGI